MSSGGQHEADTRLGDEEEDRGLLQEAVTLVTESLTLMAGILRSPFFIILYRLWTPVVVSSDTPRIPGDTPLLPLSQSELGYGLHMPFVFIIHVVKEQVGEGTSGPTTTRG